MYVILELGVLGVGSMEGDWNKKKQAFIVVLAPAQLSYRSLHGTRVQEQALSTI